MCRIFCSILILKFCIAFLRAEEVSKNDIHEYHLNESNVGADEEETVTWNEFMMKATMATHQLIDYFQPTLNQTLTSGNLSMPCVKSLQLYFDGIKTWEPWAIKMVDANGKIPSGLLAGTMMDYGSFDQCLQVRSRSKGISEPFKGQYCMVKFKSLLVNQIDMGPITSSDKSYVGNPPDWISEYMQERKGFLEISALCLGICIPSTCSEKDIHIFLSTALKPWSSEVEISNCQDDTPKPWSSEMVLATLSLATLFGICILGTIVDFMDHRQQCKLEEEESAINEGVWRTVLKAFSLTRNSAKLFEKRVKTSPLDTLDGIRFFLSLFVIAAHAVFYMEHLKEYKVASSNNLFTIFGYSTIILENGFIIIENFLIISGFSLFCTTAGTLKSGRKINLIKFVIKKYFRWMPTVILSVITAFVISHMSEGPLWNSTWKHEINKCGELWWPNAIFIQNFGDPEKMCSTHTWYLATLIQNEIVGLVLLLIIFRFRKTGVVISLLMVIACISVDYITSLSHKIPRILFNARPTREMVVNFVRYIYFRPFNHFFSFASGMVLGWIFITHKDTKLSKTFRAVCWVASFTCMFVSLYGIMIPTTNLKIIAAYYAIRNVLFSLGACWILFSLFTGHGGFMNTFLSREYFVPLGRISFCIYMFHPIVLLFRAASRRERLFMGTEELIFDTIPLFILSIPLAMIGYITIELPFNSAFDILYKKFIGKETSKTISSTKGRETQNEKHKSN